MNKTQKGACAGLVLVVFLLYIPAIDLVDKRLGLLLTHIVGYSVGLVDKRLGLLLTHIVGYSVGLPLLLLVIYLMRRIDTGRGVRFDERDKLIIKKAIITAFAAVSVVLIAWYILTLFSLGESGLVSVSKLPVIVYAVSVLFIFVCSSAALVQYGRGGRKHE